jgi:hypothetical protein
MYRISSNGGGASPLAAGDGHLPRFLPDGRHFLYYWQVSPTPPGVFVGDIEGSESRQLLEADTAATYIPSGHLVFGREGTLFAQAFDAERLVLTGHPFQVAAQVAISGWTPALSVSATNTLVYRMRSSANPSSGPLAIYGRSSGSIDPARKSGRSRVLTLDFTHRLHLMVDKWRYSDRPIKTLLTFG